jgi:hypothetical protein
MKKFITAFTIMTAVLVGSRFFCTVHAQSSTPPDTLTFYRLVPGTYVNGWPRFTVHYPKEWVERPSNAGVGQCFGASTPGSHKAGLMVFVYPSSLPLEKLGEIVLPAFRNVYRDVTVVSDEPSQLRDGTPAREIQAEMVIQGSPSRFLLLAAKKDDLWVQVNVTSTKAQWGEDLKAVAYSLNLQRDAEKPVKVPVDVQELLDRHCSASVAHDLAKVMANYSDRYRNSGSRKGERELFLRALLGSTTSCEIVITDFVSAGDIAHIAGSVTHSPTVKGQLQENSIIKENGEWKWYGNQREVAP